MKNKVFPALTALFATVLMSFSFQSSKVTIISSVIAPEGGINFFDGSWEDALKMAKDENKLIFLDAMASWCGPCNYMSAKVFTDKSVADYYNTNFINVKMDMEKHPDGPELSRKFEIGNYPTLIFVDKNGKVIKQSIGKKEVQELLDLGKSVN